MADNERQNALFREKFRLALFGGHVLAAILVFGTSTISCSKSLPKAPPKDAQVCDVCKGDGKQEVLCVKCRGKGYYGGENCVACNHTGKIEKVCPYCAGSGKKPPP